jgi:L-lactate dehydrogenase complex protein LldG
VSAREEILARVRTALADRPRPDAVRRDYRHAAGAAAAGGGGDAATLDLLVERLEDYRARVHRADAEQLPGMLATLLTGRVVVPAGCPDSWLTRLGGRVVRDDPPLSARELDRVDAVLTTCAVAVAETGTVVLDAGPGQGRRALTLVPDHHVVVVRPADVVAAVPHAVSRLDARRPQTWISGPSATSDIELNRVEGVHGPRSLDVVVLS